MHHRICVKLTFTALCTGSQLIEKGVHRIRVCWIGNPSTRRTFISSPTPGLLISSSDQGYDCPQRKPGPKCDPEGRNGCWHIGRVLLKARSRLPDLVFSSGGPQQPPLFQYSGLPADLPWLPGNSPAPILEQWRPRPRIKFE